MALDILRSWFYSDRPVVEARPDPASCAHGSAIDALSYQTLRHRKSLLLHGRAGVPGAVGRFPAVPLP